MPVNWGQANEGQFDYLQSLQAIGNSQAQKLNTQRGQYAFDQQRTQDAARPGLFAQAQGGDFAGASNGALANNDLDAYKIIAGLDDDKRRQVGEHADLIAATATGLAKYPEGSPQRLQAFDAAAPGLLQRGFTADELRAARANVSTNAGLQGYISAASNTKDALASYYKSIEPYSLADGTRRVQPGMDGTQNVVAENPKDAPQPQYVLSPDGSQWLLKPGTGGMPTGGASMPTGQPGGGGQPAGGADVVSRMIPITLGSEGGGSLTAPKVSPKGARGPMQVMPGTNASPGFGIAPARDGSEEERARVGRDYLAAMVQRYGDPAKAWAAYNAGPGRVDSAIASGGNNWLSAMPAETRAYVSKNMAQLGGQNMAPQSRSAGPPGSVPTGLPPKNTEYRILSPEEARARRLDPDSRWQLGPNNQVTSLPSKGDKPLTESQGKAVGYLERAVAAADTLNSIPKAPSPNEANAYLYGLSTTNPLRRNISPEAQRALSAQEAFVLAVLRQDSGAAINKDEVTSAMRIYFPQPGDSASTQADKRRQREAAIRGLRMAAGPGADNVRGSVAPGAGARGPLRVLKIERVQ